MRNLAFSRHQVERAIRVNGKRYTVLRDGLNQFKEPDGTQSVVVELVGLWHESGSYFTLQGADGSTVQSKKTPRVLTLMEYAKGIKQGDFIFAHGTRYNVNGVDDVSELGVFADISLEAVI